MTSNPFATRYVQPGAIPWFSTNTHSLDYLEKRFHRLGRRVAIVGPHGSGKSTLMGHLIPKLGPVTYRAFADGQQDQLRDRENGIVWLQLRKPDAQHRIRQSKDAWAPGGLLAIDGWEQISWLGRFRILLATNRIGLDLLVTSHCAAWGLPALVQLTVDAERANDIVQFLLRCNPGRGAVQLTDLQHSLHKHQMNLREVLMDLYDQFQNRST